MKASAEPGVTTNNGPSNLENIIKSVNRPKQAISGATMRLECRLKQMISPFETEGGGGVEREGGNQNISVIKVHHFVFSANRAPPAGRLTARVPASAISESKHTAGYSHAMYSEPRFPAQSSKE